MIQLINNLHSTLKRGKPKLSYLYIQELSKDMCLWSRLQAIERYSGNSERYILYTISLHKSIKPPEIMLLISLIIPLYNMKVLKIQSINKPIYTANVSAHTNEKNQSYDARAGSYKWRRGLSQPCSPGILDYRRCRHGSSTAHK